MSKPVRRGAICGAAFGVLLLLGILALSLQGPSLHKDEAVWLAGSLATIAGLPTTLVARALMLCRREIGVSMMFYLVTFVVLYVAAVVVNWTLIGAIVGWAVAARVTCFSRAA